MKLVHWLSVWYSDEGLGGAAAHPSTANVLIIVLLK